MRRDFQFLFPQRPGYVALISVLTSPVPNGFPSDKRLAPRQSPK